MLPAGFGLTNNNRPLVIGGRTIGSSNVDDFDGLIEEIRVYNEAVLPCHVPVPELTSVSIWAGTIALVSLFGLTKRR
jgi:hypothetical protein